MNKVKRISDYLYVYQGLFIWQLDTPGRDTFNIYHRNPYHCIQTDPELIASGFRSLVESVRFIDLRTKVILILREFTVKEKAINDLVLAIINNK
jgi:hypothetical protein